MKNLFLQSFLEDLEFISKQNNNKLNIQQKLKAHDDFWNSLSTESKEKFLKFQKLLDEDDFQIQNELYVYALKKGFFIGYETAKSFI